jgi:hypothetical protein
MREDDLPSRVYEAPWTEEDTGRPFLEKWEPETQPRCHAVCWTVQKLFGG